MRSPRHSDFLIGEETLDEGVEFFAPSADASSPAAADPLVETTPGHQSDRLPTDGDRGRGSAWATGSFARRAIVGAALVGSCAALVALISGSTSTKHEPSTATPSGSVSATSGNHGGGGARPVVPQVHDRRRSARRRRHGGESGHLASVGQRSTSPRPDGLVRRLATAPPVATSPMPPSAPMDARSAREFEFER
jgi:hypothetical protein